MPNSLQLGNLVQQLKLSGISDSLESRLRQAKDASMPYEDGHIHTESRTFNNQAPRRIASHQCIRPHTFE